MPTGIEAAASLYRLLAWLCSRVPGAPGIVRAVSVRNNLEAQDENR